MNRNFMNHASTVLFGLALLLIYSCQSEEEYLHNKQGDYLKITTKSLHELKKESRFMSALNKIPKINTIQENFHYRSEMENQYGFTFIDSPVKIIEKDGIIYYTIQIISDDNIDGKIENLVLSTDTQENGYIVKYNSNKSEEKKYI